MVDVSDEELVMLENAFEETLNLLAEAEGDPKVEQVKQIVVEAQQIVSSKIEGSGSGKEMIQEASPSGPGV
jgi:hypothetical protein